MMTQTVFLLISDIFVAYYSKKMHVIYITVTLFNDLKPTFKINLFSMQIFFVYKKNIASMRKKHIMFLKSRN
jgi:hypothetical protein